MKYTLFLLVMATSSLILTNKSTAQSIDTASYKYKLAKTWYFNYSEKFGVKVDPDSTQKKDIIVFTPDQTYKMISEGVNSNGTWNVSEASHFLTIVDSKTKQARSIKIVGLIKDQLALKWQAADLTAVYKYYYAK